MNARPRKALHVESEYPVRGAFCSRAYKSKKAHLCFACLNGYPSKCEKVADYRKKNLDDYSFIEEGYQTFNTENNLFIVLKCQHCVPIMNK